MRTLLTIAHREYVAMIGTKAFLLTLILMPVLMLGGMLAMPLINRIEGPQERRIVVADATGQWVSVLQRAAEQRLQAANAMADSQASSNGDNPFDRPQDRFVIEAASQAPLSAEEQFLLSDQIREGTLFALVEIPAELEKLDVDAATRRVRFVSNAGTLSEVRGWISGVLSDAVRTKRLQEAGIDPQVVAVAETRVDVAAIRPYDRSKVDEAGSKKEGEEESLANVFAPFLMMMLMFIVIFLAAQPMLESAMEEKTQRISEVLLGSVTSTQLMAGKLLGNVAGSMVIFLVYGIGGVFLLHRYNMLELLPLNLIGWFLVFQIGAVLFYSSIFLSVGAAVSQLKEAQSLLLPVWMILAAPMMIWFVALRDPNGLVATAMSFFPPSAPLMMVLRLGTGTAVPSWQPPVAALLLFVAAIAVIVIAGRIYRVSLLRADGAKSFLQLLSRVAAH
jgi:ABC-type Na+ efflux pump permease subunit